MSRDLLTALTLSLLTSITVMQSALADQANLAAKGKQLVLVCSGCHNFAEDQPHKIGPNLWNVVGRKVGSAEGFAYSDAFKQFKGSWSIENLNHYLASPATFIPNNQMAFSGISSETDRKAVIAYLETLTTDGPMVGASTGFDYGGLTAGYGRDDVYSVCSRCHSIMLVKQQGMNRSRWKKTLDWMVEEQGMDQLPEKQQERILDYLATHYGE